MATIEINRENLYFNLNWFSKKVGSKDKIAVVLKDNAYGHGLEIMANLCSKFGITKAVVRDYKEARSIERYFQEILILGDYPIKHNKFSFVLNSIEDIKRAKSGSKVELKINTGMERNGIEIEDLNQSLTLIKKRGLALVGVLSHNRSADELSSELFWQQKRFNRVKEIIKNRGLKNIRFHSFNSSSTIRLDAKREDLVRIGIGIYGYSEINNIFTPPKLKPVMALYANRTSSREIKSGTRVGYGGDFIANRDMRVSSYDIGYGDGLFRGDSKNPLTIADGIPILGRVSMDYIILESTNSRVCIFNNAKEVAKHYNTISYEILTRLSPSIERVVI
jgi:alanine racemase